MMKTTRESPTMTRESPTTRASATEDRPPRPTAADLIAEWRRRLGSVRVRLLFSYILLLGIAAVISVFVVRQVLLVRLDDRVQENLEQEVDEFQRLAEEGVDPATGRPLSERPNQLFRLYLQRNVPGEGEELVTIPRDGKPRYRFSERAEGYLINQEEILDRWARLDEVERGELETPVGEARYVAVPVRLDDRPVGSFAVANFVQGELDEVNEAVRIVAVVSGFVLILGSALAFLATSRVLAPVRELRDAARSITGTDMTRRIAVRGDDELAELAQTFNTMLDRLDHAFSSQRDFMRDVGHELRTPITIIRGHLELLAEQGDVDRAYRRDVLELVTDELDRMRRFVEDLSLLARAERPDFLRLETVQLSELTDELIGKAGRLAARDWQLDGTSPVRVVADRQRITQAVMSLADNAAKHTEPGDEIGIGAGVNGSEARLWVRDTGPGIPPDDRGSIFERFRRGRTSDRRYEGTGLGLAIVRAIAQAHGGRVEVGGEPGRGARFDIVIPIEQDSQPADERPTVEIRR
jgi:two-component system, OmpR family, sensor kinase